jgi:hypothetical protein
MLRKIFFIKIAPHFCDVIFLEVGRALYLRMNFCLIVTLKAVAHSQSSVN